MCICVFVCMLCDCVRCVSGGLCLYVRMYMCVYGMGESGCVDVSIGV